MKDHVYLAMYIVGLFVYLIIWDFKAFTIYPRNIEMAWPSIQYIFIQWRHLLILINGMTTFMFVFFFLSTKFKIIIYRFEEMGKTKRHFSASK